MRGFSILAIGLVVPLTLAAREADREAFQVPRGQMTFDAEGQEGGRWHSRTWHVPSEASGRTIGRGYDMKHRTPESIERDLVAAGLKPEDAKLYAGAAKLSGEKAREYARQNALPEITPAQQKKLFAITYAEIESLTRKLCESKEVAERYGACDWAKRHPAIQELLIDLRYRGDYTTGSRKAVQPLVVANDLAGLAKLMQDREFWKSVPKDRFDRRAKFAQQAVEAAAKK